LRPPPFILVVKSNAPRPSEMAGTRGERMFFLESEFVSEMENMASSGCQLSVLTLCIQGPYNGFVPVIGTQLSCIQSPHTRPHRGNTAGFLFLARKAPQHFLSLLIKRVRASARKLRWRPLAASQTLCLPPPDSMRNRSPQPVAGNSQGGDPRFDELRSQISY